MRRFVFMVLALAATSVHADGPTASRLKELSTGDQNRGWEAVGRLDMGLGSFCTGALIETDLVLTAAHCLYDGKTGLRVPVENMRFLAGWRNGRAEAYRGVRRAVPHPEYRYDETPHVGRVAVDLALVELDQPIRSTRILPFETSSDLARGREVGVVSYAEDRSEAPSLQEVCHVLEQHGGAVMLSCSIDFGSSGAPIFLLGEDRPRIVSVVSAKAEADGQPVALASEVERSLTELHSALLPEIRSRGMEGATPGNGSATVTTGAKFIRP